MVQALSPAASAVLLDPEFGVPAVREAGVMAAGCATLVAVEPAERDSWAGEPRARRDPERTASWVRDMGGDAVKLLVQLRPDRPHRPGEPDLVAEVVQVVQAVVDDCAAAGVPSVVETLLYRLPGEDPLPDRRRADLIAESARILTETRPDLLKLEYPVDARGCAAVAGAVTVPWAMLSAGMPFPAFLDAVATSCDHGGASGFIAGRVYWQEAVAMTGPARQEFLATVGLATAGAVHRGHGRAGPAVGQGWPAEPVNASGTLLVGVDVGTTRIKAGLVDVAGRERGYASVPTRWRRLDTGAEADPDDFQHSVRQVLAELLAAAPPGEILGVGVTSMAETAILLDAAGRAAGPAVAWFDRRAAAEHRQLEADLSAAEIGQRTGLTPGQIPTIATLRWLVREYPALRQASQALTVAEWVVYGLGGAAAAEASLASRTGALSVAQREWWPDAVRWAGLAASIFPEIRAGRDVLGPGPRDGRRAGLAGRRDAHRGGP